MLPVELYLELYLEWKARTGNRTFGCPKSPSDQSVVPPVLAGTRREGSIRHTARPHGYPGHALGEPEVALSELRDYRGPLCRTNRPWLQ